MPVWFIGDSEEPVVLCPHCAAKAYDEMPFFMKYSELAEIKPNSKWWG